jgi:hypothetical protein
VGNREDLEKVKRHPWLRDYLERRDIIRIFQDEEQVVVEPMGGESLLIKISVNDDRIKRRIVVGIREVLEKEETDRLIRCLEEVDWSYVFPVLERVHILGVSVLTKLALFFIVQLFLVSYLPIDYSTKLLISAVGSVVALLIHTQVSDRRRIKRVREREEIVRSAEISSTPSYQVHSWLDAALEKQYKPYSWKDEKDVELKEIGE